MNVYLANFPGMWRGGTAVVVADNEQQAKALLLIELELQKIRSMHGKAKSYPSADQIDVSLIEPAKAGVYIADDGDS